MAKTHFKTRKRKTEFKLSEETAQEQLAILLDFYELYPDEFENQSQTNLYEMHCANLVKGIRSGRLEISNTDGNLQIVQNTKNFIESGPIIYKELSFKAKMQGSGIRGETSDAEAIMPRRNAAILGELSGLGVDGISMLKGVDMSLAESLAFLFGLV